MISAWCNFTGENLEFCVKLAVLLHSSEIESDSCRAGVDSWQAVGVGSLKMAMKR